MSSSKLNILYLGLLIATIATFGSLYFSKVLNFTPCVLCWYQRIAMYPLVLIFATGIYLKEKKIHYYVLPFSILGLLIAIYHNLIYYKIIPEEAASCSLQIPCGIVQLELFGFITIPLLSLASFAAITALMLIFRRVK